MWSSRPVGTSDYQGRLFSFPAQPIKTIQNRWGFNQLPLEFKFPRIIHQYQSHQQCQNSLAWQEQHQYARQDQGATNQVLAH